VATRVLARCLTEPRYSVLVFSPTEDQSKEFLSYVAQMNDDLGCPVPLIRQSLSELAWSNGSRVKAKADSPRGSRGFTPNMIVVDEGAQVSDELYLSIKPMMVLGQSEMMVLSTPFGKHGWFFDIWDDPKKLQKWETFKVTAYDCPRIDPAVLEEHRLTMPARWFNQEYNCHRPTSKVVLWSGIIREVQHLRVGDKLCCVNRDTGLVQSCNVVEKRSTGIATMNRVTLETGDVFVASDGHPVQTRSGRVSLCNAADLHLVPNGIPSLSKDAALARLVGFNTGDGTITRRGSGAMAGKLSGGFYSKYHDDLVPVSDDMVLAGLCEKPPRIQSKKGKPGTPDTYQIQFGNQAALRMVEAGCPIGKKVNVAFGVPQWILEGSKEIRREYVAALWGAEGSCACGRSLTIGMAKSLGVDGLRFWRAIQDILENDFLVSTNLVTKVCSGKQWHQLLVTGGSKGFTNFVRRVGYRYSRYKTAAAHEWTCYIRARAFAGRDRVVKVRDLVASGLSYSAVGRQLGCSKDVAYFLNSGAVAGNRINGFPGFDEWVATRRSKSGIYLSVVSREQLPAEDVVNIEVDSPDHSYLMSSGIDNFNCEFNDAVDAVFGKSVIDAAERDDARFEPLYLGTP
jgi:hypothetical protein